ncbi:DUF502 domain-containing protein [Flaviaesturariibacter aridisoli]|uniref:DUF502 domain-containing protein n=1 Tax=Flaviaesturariibacter aridisoli TaxID=2545761 RepID=A0A4R4DYY5_9BACT|nr:DUF502 domain-containing protein [Flaviaesturariibacter aridisoli]TCZ68839.1 DUF502 domain-containing protein [Flaviaesturariibacter aridisoli]
MDDRLHPPKERFRVGSLFQYFLQGLLVIAPVVITAWAVYWVVDSIDNLIPIFVVRQPGGQVVIRNYGLGFVLVLVVVCLIGYLSTFFIRNRVFALFDSLLSKTPGIRFIYSTVKDFTEALGGEKKKFNRPVLANIDDTDVWRIGFITQDHARDFGFEDYVAVYIPMSYSIAGNVYLLPEARVRPISNINATDAMKFAISGGVTHVEEGKHHPDDHAQHQNGPAAMG